VVGGGGTTYNINRPFSAYTVPVQVKDPGPDAVVNTADDGQFYTMYNLSPEALALPIVNTYTNIDGAESEYTTFELTGTKRMSHGWSAMLSFSRTWSAAQNNTFFGTGFRQNLLAVSPQDLINTEPNGQIKYTDWSLKLNGTWIGPWDLKISPMLRFQAGQNWGRTFQATMNYGTVRIAAEPLDTNRQRDIAVTDIRVEKQFGLGSGIKVGPSSTSTTSSTPTPSRTSPGRPGRRSCGRRPSSRHASGESAPRSPGKRRCTACSARSATVPQHRSCCQGRCVSRWQAVNEHRISRPPLRPALLPRLQLVPGRALVSGPTATPSRRSTWLRSRTRI
jgi:hypothetical protein